MANRPTLVCLAAFALVALAAPLHAEPTTDPVTHAKEVAAEGRALLRRGGADEAWHGWLDGSQAAWTALVTDGAPDLPAAEAAARRRGRAEIEDLWLRVFVMERPDRTRSLNVHEPLNIEAARLLGETGNRDLAPRVRTLIDQHLVSKRGRDLPASSERLDASFLVLARLGDPRTLDWMMSEFVHTRSSPPWVVDLMVAAQAALARYDLRDISGPRRLKVVERFVRFYATVEDAAGRGSLTGLDLNQKILWGRIRVGVLACLQHFSGSPKDAQGVAPGSVNEFREWLRTAKPPAAEGDR